MQTTTLGRTGLTVSVAGLGCGGGSKLGQVSGRSIHHSVDLIFASLDLGINFFDTAAAYGTEEILGQALLGRRDEVVISTKQGVMTSRAGPLGQDFLSAKGLRERVEGNLSRLKTDYLDILQLHGVMPDQYQYCMQELYPELLRLQAAGKVRFLGITERFQHDTNHMMLHQALRDDVWDVVMVGFNMVNPSARRRVFAASQRQNVGTLVMHAVRRALQDPSAVRKKLAEVVRCGQMDPDILTVDNPLDFLLEGQSVGSIVEAAYRFCRHEPGAHVTLFGTGKKEHLISNTKYLQMPALPQDALDRLGDLFGEVNCVSGD